MISGLPDSRLRKISTNFIPSVKRGGRIWQSASAVKPDFDQREKYSFGKDLREKRGISALRVCKQTSSKAS